MDVGVRELKQHLSSYLERAARGEIIRITDRGKAKAILGPLPGRVALDEGILQGWIRAGSGEPPVPTRRHRAVRSIAEVMREDRDE